MHLRPDQPVRADLRQKAMASMVWKGGGRAKAPNAASAPTSPMLLRMATHDATHQKDRATRLAHPSQYAAVDRARLWLVGVRGLLTTC